VLFRGNAIKLMADVQEVLVDSHLEPVLVSGGVYTISPQHNPACCFTVEPDVIGDNVINLRANSGNSDQRFVAIQRSDELWSFVSEAPSALNAPRCALDGLGFDDAVCRFKQFLPGEATQQFGVRPVDGAWCVIESSWTPKVVLDVNQAGGAGAAVVMWYFKEKPHQMFRFDCVGHTEAHLDFTLTSS
jgi:hypothetical protein